MYTTGNKTSIQKWNNNCKGNKIRYKENKKICRINRSNFINREHRPMLKLMMLINNYKNNVLK